MPVRNEADFIASSLGSVLDQDYPGTQIEVLISDGMSTDQTSELVEEMSISNPDINIKLLKNEGQFVAAGLNLALQEARGEIIVRVDGHCTIAKDYVSNCVKHLQTQNIVGVGGSITTIATTPVGTAIAAAMSSPFGVGSSAFRTVKGKTMPVDTVPFPAYTKRAMDAAGPFDEELKRNQDDEYNYRLRKLGGTILLAADVHSEYYSRTSLSHLWRQYLEYGFYKVRVMQKHPRQMSWRQFIPPLFVLSLILGGILAPFVTAIRLLWFVMMMAYLAANLLASLMSARRVEKKGRIYLPIAYAILHISYGLGFLAGLIYFANRWGEKESPH